LGCGGGGGGEEGVDSVDEVGVGEGVGCCCGVVVGGGEMGGFIRCHVVNNLSEERGGK